MRFVLIHGGFHGEWCWDRLVPVLGDLGHEAIAIDLPGHGSRKNERSTLADRRDAIVEVLLPGDILVGHSGGGFDITMAADAAPDLVNHMVYLAAGLPIEGKTVLDATGGATSKGEDGSVQVLRLKSDETGMSNIVRRTENGRMECFDYEGARDYFYHDCDDQTARWAFSKLTPAPVKFLVETVSIPKFWAANIPRSYILCLQDRAKSREASEAVINRLGVDALTIDTSHSPFLSKPRELAELLEYALTTSPKRALSPT